MNDLDKISFSDFSTLPFFFIIGRPRSGTTLLRLFLDAHPDVSIPTDCIYIAQLKKRYRSLKKWDSEKIDHFMMDLQKTRFFEISRFNASAIQAYLLEEKSKLTFEKACRIVAAHYNSVFPKKEILAIGDKNPLYSFIPEYVLSVFPNARILHLIRDPRDNHVSICNTHFGSHPVSLTVKRWETSFQKMEKFRKSTPELYHRILFEDLICNPENSLKEICRFLNIPFNPCMLHYLDYKNKFSEIYPENFLNKVHLSIQKPPDISKIGIWKKTLTERQRQIAEQIAGKSISELGYEKSVKRVTIASKVIALPGIFGYYFHLLVLQLALFLPYRIQRIFVNNFHRFNRLNRVFRRKKTKVH